MKKTLLFLAVMTLAICAFAISVSAAGSSSNEYGTVTVIDGMAEPTVLDKDAKVVIVASDGTYYTFPSYYILEDRADFCWKQNKDLNTLLGYNATMDRKNIRNYIIRMEIPEGIKTSVEISDGGSKFEDSKSVIEVSLPTTLELMGEYFFEGCTNLAMVTGLENTKVTKLYYAAFCGTKISQVVIPDTVTVIAEKVFSGCTQLTSVVIPDTVTNLGGWAFASCTNLASVTITENSQLTTIGSYAFEKTKLTSFYFPSTVEALTGEGGLFFQCYSLATVENLGNTRLTSIPYRTFHGCPITSISLPSSLTSIGNYAFSGHKLTQDKLVIPNGVTSIGQCALAGGYSGNEAGIGELVLPANLQTLGTYAFEHIKVGRMTVYLSNSVTSIPEGVFNNWTSNFVIFYTGTLAELETLKANTSTTGNKNGAFLGASIKSVSEYGSVETVSGRTIVYGYEKCFAFYGGHAWKGETNVIAGNYFEPIGIGDTCANCGKGEVKENIAPIFTWKGYSACTFGEGYSVVQGFYVNKTSIDEYLAYVPDFNYGILATVNAGGEAITPKLGDENVITSNFDKEANDYLDIKVTGIPANNLATKVIFCVYVTVGEKMYYLDNNTTGEAATGISYSEVVALSK